MSESHLEPTTNPTVLAMEKSLLLSRYILVPFLFGLGLASVPVFRGFIEDLWSLVFQTTSEPIFVGAITLLEYIMVEILLVTVTMGSYHVYVKPVDPSLLAFAPWLKNMSSDGLKQFTVSTLLGVSTAVLLKDLYILITVTILGEQLAIHFAFLITLAVLKKYQSSKPTTKPAEK